MEIVLITTEAVPNNILPLIQFETSLCVFLPDVLIRISENEIFTSVVAEATFLFVKYHFIEVDNYINCKLGSAMEFH